MKKIFYVFICGLTTVVIGCGNNNNNNSNESSDESSREYTSYLDAVAAGDFAAAHDSLDIMHVEYTKAMSECSYIQADERSIQRRYLDALEYVYFKEFAYLLAENVEGAEDKVVFSIMEIPIDGDFTTGLVSNSYVEMLNRQSIPFNERYEINKTINKICDKALIIAINRGNIKFAQNILDLYKEDIIVTKVCFGDVIRINGIEIDHHHGYVEVKWTTKEAAKAKVDAAIKDGRLK